MCPFLLNLPPISHPSHPSKLIQRPWLSSLRHTANSHWLSILHMVIKFPCYSLRTPHLFLPGSICSLHGRQILNHWTARGVPGQSNFDIRYTLFLFHTHATESKYSLLKHPMGNSELAGCHCWALDLCSPGRLKVSEGYRILTIRVQISGGPSVSICWFHLWMLSLYSALFTWVELGQLD